MNQKQQQQHQIHNVNSNLGNNPNLSKLNLSNIYTVEPLRIKLHENDEPRAPSLEEAEVFISKLYDLYKHQKQQVSNYFLFPTMLYTTKFLITLFY
jgi:hypothetical protein